MNSKLFGGILLVIGTTIGAGMLALPIATAQLGFWGSTILLISSWAVMMASALLFLEVNLWLPPNSNLVSMAGATLGRAGQGVTWVVYLVLLYSIICAYIAGGGDLFHYLLSSRGIPVSLGFSSVIFTLLFGSVVYFGIRCVDYVNRGLMFGKMGAFILLIVLILPFISTGYLTHGKISQIVAPSGITVTAVAFGSLMIIPSLRTYFEGDIPALRKAIVIGITIPLFCYIAWDLVIMGVIPFHGSPGLEEMSKSGRSNSDIVYALSSILQVNSVTMLTKFFTSICMATSFLSVSLSLSDFLADGLRVKKAGFGNVIVFASTFVPPLLIVLFFPNVFMKGLNYAGLCVFVLMILLPPLMVWGGRYHKLYEPIYKVGGGKFLLASLVIFATLMIGFGLEGTI